MTKRQVIPPKEFGPGSRLIMVDGELCVRGVSGAIYKDLLFDREDVMRLWPAKEPEKDPDT
jgi:hypothetical protein